MITTLNTVCTHMDAGLVRSLHRGQYSNPLDTETKSIKIRLIPWKNLHTVCVDQNVSSVPFKPLVFEWSTPLMMTS